MATFNSTVAASSDDARQISGGTMELTGGYPNTNGSATWVGFRFTNVTIPQGATINSAAVSLAILAYDDPDLDIYGDDVDDAATFTTTSNNISSRALTTASTARMSASIGAYRLAKFTADRVSMQSRDVRRALCRRQRRTDRWHTSHPPSPADPPIRSKQCAVRPG